MKQRTKITVSGVIVGQSFDSQWFESAIQKGVITPLSRIQSAFASAKDVTLYINSQGGSIWAGNEIVNAVNAHIAAGNDVEIVVGALAASAAAGILAQVNGASKVVSAKNAAIMFHSAATETWGGPGAHEDSAKILSDYNAQIIDALVAKSGKPASEFEGWFAEGRMAWLTAKQAKALKLVDEISGEVAEKPSAPEQSDQTVYADHKLDAAAFSLPEPGSEFAMQALREEYEARIAGLQAAKDKEISDAKQQIESVNAELAAAKASASAALAERDALAADKTRLEAEASGHQDSLAKLQADLAESGKQLAQAQQNLDRISSGALGRPESGAVNSFEEAVAACGNNSAEARKKYPALYEAYMAAAGSKGN